MLTEESIIARVRDLLGGGRAGVCGIGDDAVQLLESDGRIVATDTMVEGVHFRLDWSSPYDVGWKLVVANVRDMDAMGAKARAALLSLSLRADLGVEWLDQFLQGMAAARGVYAPSLTVVGGDTTGARTSVVASLTLIGATEGEPWLRSGLKVGHKLWLDGPVGRAAAGLYALESGLRDDHRWRHVIDHHLRPQPTPLATSLGIEACMDLSDGLSSALNQMAAASSKLLVIDEALLPTDFGAIEGQVSEAELRRFALHGAEDHTLLAAAYTSPGDSWTLIGQALDGEDVLVRDHYGAFSILEPESWTHSF